MRHDQPVHAERRLSLFSPRQPDCTHEASSSGCYVGEITRLVLLSLYRVGFGKNFISFQHCLALPVLSSAMLVSGCAVIVERGDNFRDYHIIGYARVRVPNPEVAGEHLRVLEVSGVGIAMNRVFQLGYFKEFEASIKPDSNSAVIVLRSDADYSRLETLLKQLNQNGLCLIIKDQRS